MARPPSPKPAPQATLSFGLPFELAATLLASLLGFAASGCTPSIGDKCTLSTDCSVQGNRVCDTFEPNGYCTVVCSVNSCPDNAACIEFGAGIPGCGYSDYASPSRFGRSMCMKKCNADSDCRTDEGYTCVPTTTLGTTVQVLDTYQTPSICMIGPGVVIDGGSLEAPVCSPDRPDAPPLDLSLGGGNVGIADAGGDVGDAALAEGDDATTSDGGDDGSDATLGQATDAGAADAPDEP